MEVRINNISDKFEEWDQIGEAIKAFYDLNRPCYRIDAYTEVNVRETDSGIVIATINKPQENYV